MNGWSLAYDAYRADSEGVREALTALGNGYFVTPGAAAEVDADGIHYPGTYLAGGYNRLVTEIEGWAIENEHLVNLPNWLVLKIRIDGGEWLGPDKVRILDFRHELDLRSGVLHRTLVFEDGQQRTTRWSELAERLERTRVEPAAAPQPEIASLAP